MSVKEHYDNHLAEFYAWMCGDREIRQQEFLTFLQQHKISPQSSGQAIDFGAGHGLQSIPLALAGFQVLAVDFSQALLDDLEKNKKSLAVKTCLSDMRNVQQHAHVKPELILCCGDTLLHLESKKEVSDFLKDCISILNAYGKLILSFRDYSQELKGDARFIPVKSDEDRMLTCFLEYEKEFVRVTDILHEKESTDWKLKVSSYQKVRMTPQEIISHLENSGIKILSAEIEKGMVWVVGQN